MKELAHEDHYILSLIAGIKEGKIKQKITTFSSASIAAIDNITITENCIANIKEQTQSPLNERSYKIDHPGEGAIKKEC